MLRSDQLGKLAEALAQAQGQMKGAVKDAANPFFKSKYADLASCWEAARSPLAAHGLSILQPVKATGADVTVTTILAHASGEWISEDLSVTAKDESPQSVGSAITYARRYGFSAMVGIAPEDDDGNGAQPEHTPPPRPRQPALRSPPANHVPVHDDEVQRKAQAIADAAAAAQPPLETPSRAKMIWKRASDPKTHNQTAGMFTAFVERTLGAQKKSSDWTTADMDALENALDKDAEIQF